MTIALRRVWPVLAAGLLGFAAVPATAGALTALPVRVAVPAHSQFCAITLGNEGAADIAVQIRGYRWHQDGGTDALDESQRLAVNPAIVTIPPGTRRLVRCSLPEPTGPAEDTFRLIVSELPLADGAAGTVQTLLQLSIPVFRANPDARAALSWRAAPDGRLEVTNTGTRHVRVADLVLRPATASDSARVKANAYLLAGATRVFAHPDMPPGEIAAVEAVDEDGAVLTVQPERVSQP